jgi:hypothetical protein
MLVSQALARVPRPAKTIPLEIPKQSNPGRYGADGQTRLINCYMEKAGREGKTPFPIYAADGLDLFATVDTSGGCRGLFATESRLYWVAGRLICAVDLGGGVETIGGLADDGPVYFSRNRASPQEIVVTTTGSLRYIITLSGGVHTFAEIDDTDLPPPTSNGFIDGFTLYFIRNGKVFYSELDDAGDIGANSYFEAEGNPDQLIRGFIHKSTVFVLGRETTELWDNVGTDSNNPFQRRPGGFLPYGCLSPASVVSLGDNIAFVNNSGQVVVASESGAVQRISHHAVERAIDALSEAEKLLIEGFVYERRGHRFYFLSGTNFTWVFDETTGQWHERMSENETRWRGAYYAKFGDYHIVGDFEQGRLYKINPDSKEEAGANLIMKWLFPVHAWPNAIRLRRLRVDMIPGVGENVGDTHDSDPKLMCRVSTNGGKSFGNEMSRAIGMQGQYTASTSFDKLGSSVEDGFVVELSASAAVVRACTGIAMEGDVIRR